jgi:glutamate racemase
MGRKTRFLSQFCCVENSREKMKNNTGVAVTPKYPKVAHKIFDDSVGAIATKKEVNDHSATASISNEKVIRALPACCLMIELANTKQMPVDNNKEIEKMDSVKFTFSSSVIELSQPS